MSQFNKPPLSIPDQLKLIESRGMIIPDRQVAINFLNKVNYYRFSGYCLYFEQIGNKRTHKFKTNSNFNELIKIYEFDSELRGILFSAIEECEIAFRSKICTELSVKHDDSHWYLNESLFNEKYNFQQKISEIKNEIRDNKEIFIKHYKRNYSSPELPPIWVVAEILSFGKWSKLFSGLINRSDKKLISDYFKLSPITLGSWMHRLCILRNLCAHHMRIWDRKFSSGVSLERSYINKGFLDNCVGAYMLMTYKLLRTLKEADKFKQKLVALFDEYSTIDLKAMGLPENWKIFFNESK